MNASESLRPTTTSTTPQSTTEPPTTSTSSRSTASAVPTAAWASAIASASNSSCNGSVSCSSNATEGVVLLSFIPANSSLTTSFVVLATASATLPSSSASAYATSTIVAGQQSSQETAAHSNLSESLFAGAAVGCFVAGFLTASLIAFILLKKRSKRDCYISQVGYYPSLDQAYYGEKGVPILTLTAAAAAADKHYLPQQAEDAQVERRILTLTDQIDQHVESFYSNRKINMDPNVEAKISAYETRQLPNPLALCFETASHPLVLVRHCLAFHIFSQTVGPGEDAQLILPPEIAGMISTMYHRCLSPTTSQDVIAAFSTWKRVVGYLRPDLGRNANSVQSVSDSASRFAKEFSTAFSAWANPQYPEEHRTHHLATLMDHAIETAIWVFRQPDGFKFSWNTLTHNARNSSAQNFAREVVVIPEVSKVTHKGAMLVGKGQHVMIHAIVKDF